MIKQGKIILDNVAGDWGPKIRKIKFIKGIVTVTKGNRDVRGL